MKKMIISLLAVIIVLTLGVSAGFAADKALNSKNYPLKGTHLKMKMECTDCHGTDKTFKKRIKQETCFTCHGSYADLKKKTEKLGDDNIHGSPHYPHMDCDLCHVIHTTKPTKKIYCEMCHSQPSMAKLMVP